jgi:outer membrane immunogenic protein
MKRVLFASVGVLMAAMTGAAVAADLPRRTEMPAKAPAYVTPVAYNWTGLYIGINGGGIWGHSSFTAAPPTGDFTVSGGLIGGTLGYNWQMNQVVFGLETDLDWSGARGSAACGTATCQTRNTWLGTARGRVGYAMDRFLPYLTGGLAFGDIRASSSGLAGATSTRSGWTVGGGLEFAVANNWTAKAEYLYVDLGKFDCGTACGGVPPDNVKLNANVLRAGLNYRF